MNQSEVLKIRLTTQLPANSECSGISSLVARMGALQAQDYTMSKWAIGMRLPGISDREIETAITRGELLRTHVLRPTWHWVAPENIRWMLQLSAPRIKSMVASRDKTLNLTETIFEKSNRIIVDLLTGNNYLTRGELQNELAKRGIPTDSFQLAHIAFRAEMEAIICNGPTVDKKQTYALLDERVPPTKSLSRQEALAKLAEIYFQSHAPATLDDFVWWSGLTKAEARTGIEMIKSTLISEHCNVVEYWMPANIKARTDQPVLFLPAFDELIVSYKNREAILSTEHYEKIIVSNGIFRPAIIAENQTVGSWKKVTKKNKPKIEYSIFQTSKKVPDKLLEPALTRLNQFWT